MSVRWPILFTTSFIAFSADYFYDVPSVLQHRLTGNATACQNGTDICLHLNDAQFNLLYAVYAWFGAAIVPFSGILGDKFGCKVTLIVYGILFFIGSALFSASTYLDETPAFILMMTARMIFGVGSSSTSVISSRLQSFWFKNHELGLAFAIGIVAGRLGSVTNFLFTGSLADAVGLRTTLWLGTLLCGIGLLGAVSAGYVHTVGLKRIGLDPKTENGSEPFHLSMIKDFGCSYWIICFFMVFFYAGVFPFVAEAPKFFEDRNGYSEVYAGYIAGATYDIALISPLFGFLSDLMGRRGYWVLAAPMILFSAYIFLMFIPGFPPLLFCMMMGIAYTIVAAIGWSCVPFLVPSSGVGTAMGLLTCFQMFGVGISNAMVGVFLSQRGKDILILWEDVLRFLMACAAVGLTLAIMLNISDWKAGNHLKPTQKQRHAARLLLADQQIGEKVEKDLWEELGKEDDPLLPSD